MISNENLWDVTNQQPIGNQIEETKWPWIGHALSKTEGATERAALDGIHRVHGDEVVQEKLGRRRLKKKLQ
jgi:hypothetical protein